MYIRVRWDQDFCVLKNEKETEYLFLLIQVYVYVLYAAPMRNVDYATEKYFYEVAP